MSRLKAFVGIHWSGVYLDRLVFRHETDIAFVDQQGNFDAIRSINGQKRRSGCKEVASNVALRIRDVENHIVRHFDNEPCQQLMIPVDYARDQPSPASGRPRRCVDWN